MSSKTSIKQENMNRNPDGKGGFGDNPQNINRDGRPPKERSLTNLMEKYLGNKNKEDDELTRKEQFIKHTVRLALEGDSTCMRLIWNYLDGKPTQRIEQKIESKSEGVELLRQLLTDDNEEETEKDM